MKKYLISFVLFLFSQIVWAELTDDQKAALHADMITQPALIEAINTGNDIAIAAFYNAVASPDFIVYRTLVTQNEYQSSQSPTGSLFAWSGTGGYIARSQGERDAWEAMFKEGWVNPSKSNVITAFNDIFSGSGASAVANRAHLLALSKRKATKAEELFATGVGTDASPATLTFEGDLTYIDASEARVWQ